MKRLRDLVLQLAVRGRLCPQDPSDEPAQVLLSRVSGQNRGHHRAAGSATTTRPATSGELFQLPRSWAWARFGDITKSRDGERVPVSKEERNGRAKTFDYYGASGVIDRIDDYIFDKPLLLIGEDGANLINRSSPIAFIARGRYWVNNHAHVIDGFSEVFLRYLEVFINATDLTPYVTGTAQPKMNQAKMNSIPVAVPPEPEQHRIVAKVDELTALCDRLEAAQKEREAARRTFALSALANLQQPAEIAVRGLCRRSGAIDNLSAITGWPKAVDELRKAVRNLGIRGQLGTQVPLDRADARLASKAGPAVLPTPENWQWVHLGDLVMASDSGWSPRTEAFPRTDGQWGVLKVSAVSWDRFRPDENKQLLPGVAPRLGAAVKKGDFLISRANTRDLIAKAVIVVDEPTRLMMSDKIVRLHLSDRCDDRYVLLVNNWATYAREYYATAASGVSASMKNVTRDAIYNLPVPLPPLAEQHRIVSKVKELMTLCDQLEAHLKAGDMARSRLLDALIAETLAEPHAQSA